MKFYSLVGLKLDIWRTLDSRLIPWAIKLNWVSIVLIISNWLICELTDEVYCLPFVVVMIPSVVFIILTCIIWLSIAMKLKKISRESDEDINISI